MTIQEDDEQEVWTRVSRRRFRDAIDPYEDDEEHQRVELAKLLKAHGLDINKPMRSKYHFDSRCWLLREDPEGELITLEKLKSAP